MLLWASCYPLITVGLDSAPHLTFAVLRAVLAGTTLLAVGIILRKPFPRDGSIWGWIILAGLGMTGLGYYGMFHAAEFVSPGLATVIANSQPLIAAGLAFAFLGTMIGMEEGEAIRPMLGVAAFPVFLGVAYLGLWVSGRNERKA